MNLVIEQGIASAAFVAASMGIVPVTLSCGHVVRISVHGKRPKRPSLFCEGCQRHREVSE